MQQNLILIKLGGSLITDKCRPFTARRAVIARLGREIKSALKLLKNTDLLIAHGSGSFGHTVAAQYDTQNGIDFTRRDLAKLKGFPQVADAAIQINRIVMAVFLKLDLPVVSFAPLSFIFNGAQAEQFVKPIAKALEIGLIPVIYGDVIMDAARGFGIFSGEKTLNLLARHFIGQYQKIRIIEAGDTNGVYDQDGRTIPVITPKTLKSFVKSITKSDSTDVTGGMLHKVEEAIKLASELGIETIIMNGQTKANLFMAARMRRVRGTKIQR